MLQNKVFRNASWIIAGKVAQSVLNLVITMLTARYLGPSNYGLISYAASIVAFAADHAAWSEQHLGAGNGTAPR